MLRDKIGGCVVLTDKERDQVWDTLMVDTQTGQEFEVRGCGLKYRLISSEKLPNDRARTTIEVAGKRYVVTGSIYTETDRIWQKVRKIEHDGGHDV